MKDFPWFKNYPASVGQEINPDSYKSVAEIIEESFNKYGKNAAYVSMDKELSYKELDQQSKNFAAYLQGLGLKKGDKIALMMPNLLQYPIALFGAIRAGLIVVNTNPLYTVREMTHQFNDSGAETLVVLSNFAAGVEKALPKTKIKNVIITDIGDRLGGFKSVLVNFVVKYIKKLVPAYHIPNAVKFNSTLSKGASQKFSKPEISAEDLVFFQYTGGTTGVSKGAMLTNR
ncbi:MAG: AMP-binding protein, partial [Flammeovirgaceae bacterium]|nr:AMP-binding protein [Flammeovirgaceae bacterium]